MSKLLSITEYAAIHGKDPGNIRRHLANGRMQGEKIGNQWAIPEDEPYPEDRREKSGKYRNWRKIVSLHANKELMEALKSLTAELKDIYGDLLQAVILYGSYARGTHGEESDIDIALLLESKPSETMTNRMIEKVADYELEYDKVFSVIDIQSGQYETWKKDLPFYMNIDKEGITLWKAA